MVGDDGPRYILAIGGIELRHRLDDGKQADVVTGHVGHRRGNDVDLADRGELIHQQQDLVLEFGIGLRQLAGIEVDDLAEEQVDDQPAFGQLVGLDTDVDGHLLLAQCGQVKIIGTGGRIQHRVDPGIERLLEGAHDRGKGFIRLRQQVGKRLFRLGTEERTLGQLLQELAQVRAITRRQPIDGTQRRRTATRKADGQLVIAVLEQVQGKRHEGIAGLADPELLIVTAIGIQHGGNGHQVRNPERRIRRYVGQRIPAMGASIFGKRIEQVDLLPLACAPTRGQVVVLLLDVQNHHRFLIIEQVGNDHAHTLARACRRGQDDKLLARQADQTAAVLANDHPGFFLLEQPGRRQVTCVGKAGIAVYLLLLVAHKQIDHTQPGQQRQTKTNDSGQTDPAEKGLHLGQIHRRQIGVVGIPLQWRGSQPQQFKGQPTGKNEPQQQCQHKRHRHRQHPVPVQHTPSPIQGRPPPAAGMTAPSCNHQSCRSQCDIAPSPTQAKLHSANRLTVCVKKQAQKNQAMPGCFSLRCRSGGRYRVRTCDPYHVKVVLYR